MMKDFCTVGSGHFQDDNVPSMKINVTHILWLLESPDLNQTEHLQEILEELCSAPVLFRKLWNLYQEAN